MPCRSGWRRVEGPASRTARMKRIWEIPGTMAPTTKNGHKSEISAPPANSGSAGTGSGEEAAPGDHEGPRLGIGAAHQAGAHGQGEDAEERARSTAKKTATTVLGSHRGRAGRAHRADPLRDARRRGSTTGRCRLTSTTRAVIGGCALGFATGWNIANTGAVAEPARDGLRRRPRDRRALHDRALRHPSVMQIPAGGRADRFGARRIGHRSALTLIAPSTALALIAPDLALAARGPAADRCRHRARVHRRERLRAEQGGSPFAQGLFGGVALGGRRACACDRARRSRTGSAGGPRSRPPSPSRSAASRRSHAGRPTAPRRRHAREAHVPRGVVRDARLYQPRRALLGLARAERRGRQLGRDAAPPRGRPEPRARRARSAALTLVLGIATRPLGGWILHARPAGSAPPSARASSPGRSAGSRWPSRSRPALAVVGAALIGLAAGIPFAPRSQGAARLRPDAPAAAVGFVNGAAAWSSSSGRRCSASRSRLPGDGGRGLRRRRRVWAGWRSLALPERARARRARAQLQRRGPRSG